MHSFRHPLGIEMYPPSIREDNCINSAIIAEKYA